MMPKEISPSDVHTLIPVGSRVFIQGGSGAPSVLIEGLKSTPELRKAVNYTHVSIPGINHFNPADLHQGAEFTSFFMHSGLKAGQSPPGSTHFLPLNYRDIYRYLESGARFDVALIQLAPPDSSGYCSMGTSVDFVPAIIECCDRVIAQLNAAYPPAVNAPKIPFKNIDAYLHCNHSLAWAAPTTDSAITDQIAKHVSSLIDDGDCIQIGVGKLPGAILNQLKRHRRLGFHSGLLCNEARELIETGVMTGENKTRDQFKHVTGILFGNQSLYDWCAASPDVLFRPVGYTHDINTISTLDNFVSINSVLEVDLLGQANAEMIDGSQFSAVGGLLDFSRGARNAKNGRAILALPATAQNGAQSRIVTAVNHVTVCRSDIDYVVTEYGIARLSDKSVDQRAASLIEIAAPRFREALANQWQSQHRA